MIRWFPSKVCLPALALALAVCISTPRTAQANCAAVPVSTYGAIASDGIDDTVALQNAINAEDILCFDQGVYEISSSLVIPQGRNLIWLGAGFRNTILQIDPGIIGISYVRTLGQPGTTMSISNMTLVEAGLGQTSYGVEFRGASTVQHDNWLRMDTCALYGFDRAVYLKFTGQTHFTGVYAQANDTVYYLDRDSSFIYFQRCMNLGNGAFIWADDPLADGISNGIMITQCASVGASNIDVRIVGWQAVFIDQCGFDLGNGGSSAVYLKDTMDFHINSSWIASDLTLAPNRLGIHMQDSSHSGTITDNSIVNNKIGVRYDGVNNGVTAKLSIHGNKFEGNTDNEILFIQGRGIKITNNAFISTPSRTGTNYEIYGNTTGSNYCHVKNNTFRQGSYTITIGANSIVGDNIFSVPW